MSGELSMQVRLLEGEFPDYRLVLPPSHKRRVVLEREPLLGALRRVGIMASDRNNSVRCAFEEGRLLLSAQDSKAGEVREEVVADLDGAPLQTGFNARYLQEILGATRSEQLQLDMGDALDVVLRSGDCILFGGAARLIRHGIPLPSKRERAAPLH
jgi:DNA polymerase-3 subunit beta